MNKVVVNDVFKAPRSGAPTFDPADNTQQVGLTLMGGGAGADNMWGPAGGPLWVAHDPSKNVDKRRGVAVYVAASESGGVGAVDRLPEGFGPNITGGFIERIVADSTKQFADAAAAAGVAARRPFDNAIRWGAR